MKNFNQFLLLLFYQIEDLLNSDSSGLDTIKFQSEEANTDEYLKLFFKEFLTKNNRIINPYKLDVRIITDQLKTFICNNELECYHIEEVLLPNELLKEHKETIQKQNLSIYTNPDLYIKLTDGISHMFISVELKSTKNDKIPGSSVQQISPYDWVIFVQHKKNKIKVTTGMYINSITERLPFPDRSPRPEIGFNTLCNWNLANRKISNNTLEYSFPNDTAKKEMILQNWHKYLVDEWISTVKKQSKDKNCKWFDHTIRLYSLELLEYYDSISPEEQMKFKESLKSLTN